MREFYEFDEQQYERKGRIWKYIAVAVVFALLGAIGMYYMLPYISDDYSENAVVTPNEQEQKVAENDEANQEKDKAKLPELGYKGDLFITSDNPVVEIAEKVGPAVVGITNKSIITYRDWFFGDVYMQEQEGYGSGIILSDEGYIVTNAHVVEGAKELYVVFQGEKQVPAQLVGMDTTSDVAVVKVDPQVFKEVKYAVAKLGDSDKVRPGELAVAIGNPLGHDLAGTITVGVTPRARSSA
ncbi:MAG: serine protease Do [Clostridiales bacterium]|nr:serine protease Do [Clostridiales bacterium]